ncbi:hypothetical protein KAR91_28650 [Candidatus Pacearchaeota archaeon]|nr:hypothetical protein [Candidatus Pacearchaeota archaeon]
MKCTRKPEVFESYTFDEFIEHGREHSEESSMHEMPWSFDFKGLPVTHETDTCYLITSIEEMLSFTPNDILVVDILERVSVYTKEVYEKLFLPFEK